MLPIFKNDDKDFQLMQSSWSVVLNKLLRLPTSNGLILKNVSLVAGQNVVNHKLGRALQGWYVVRLRDSAQIYDTQDTNEMPELTLILQADIPVIVDLFVF